MSDNVIIEIRPRPIGVVMWLKKNLPELIREFIQQKELQMVKFKFELGDIVKDRVTGFKGVVVCRSQYLTGCNRYAIQSQALKEDIPVDWQYFDEDLLEIAGKNINMKVTKPGGPVNMEAPQR